MAFTFLPYGMVVYSHEMGQRSTFCYAVTRGVLKRSVETNPFSWLRGSAVASDHLVLAVGYNRNDTFKFYRALEEKRTKLHQSKEPFRLGLLPNLPTYCM